MKISCSVLGVILAVSVPAWSSAPYWEDFYNMASSRQEALSTPLTSTDPIALKEAGVYFFALVNGLQPIKPDKNMEVRKEHSSWAVKYLDAAYNLDETNAQIATWRATIVCSHAGTFSGQWGKQIRLVKRGIEYFNRIPKSQRDSNLDILYARIIIFNSVPLIIQDLTKTVNRDVDAYIKLYNSLENTTYWHRFHAARVMVLKARNYLDRREKEKAREILVSIDAAKLSVGQNRRDTDILDIYLKLKRRLGMDT